MTVLKSIAFLQKRNLLTAERASVLKKGFVSLFDHFQHELPLLVGVDHSTHCPYLLLSDPEHKLPFTAKCPIPSHQRHQDQLVGCPACECYPVLSSELVKTAEDFSNSLTKRAKELGKFVTDLVIEELRKERKESKKSGSASSSGAAASSSSSSSSSASSSAAAASSPSSSSASSSTPSSSSSSSAAPSASVVDIATEFPAGLPFYVTPFLVKSALADLISFRSHQIRGVVSHRFESEMRDLLLREPRHAYMIIDFGTRLQSMHHRERASLFFGKHGYTMFVTVVFFVAVAGCPGCPQFSDYSTPHIVKEDFVIFFGTDTSQTAYTSLGCVFRAVEHFCQRHSHLCVFHEGLDNGSGYHTNEFTFGISLLPLLLLYLGRVIYIAEVLYFEHGTAKTYCDRLVGRIRHWLTAIVNAGASLKNGHEACALLQLCIRDFNQSSMCGEVQSDVFLFPKNHTIKDISRYSRIRFDYGADEKASSCTGITVWENNGTSFFAISFPPESLLIAASIFFPKELAMG